ncbi:MAG TPA: single-stranded DNA-binding protein [Roseiarcus sp.]|nr:single-stranded DNA-binding protein [Roseiarcus sp.]
MSALVQISGTIFRAPEKRLTKKGSSFLTLTVKVANGNATEFWRAAVFDEDAQAELEELEQGDGVSLVGRPCCEIYQKDGAEPRVSLSLTADRAMALRGKPRRDWPFDNKKWAQTA